MNLSTSCVQAWQRFLDGDGERAHAARPLSGDSISSHVGACLKNARAAALRVRRDIGGDEIRNVVDLGASSGVLSVALSEVFPSAKVVGVEPEGAAIEAAQALFTEMHCASTSIVKGVGEALPFDSSTVDLVVCHTVIEHVRDVNLVLSEIARILRPGGVLHLEAPNYLWPYEPHIHVWCLPILGHTSIKVAAYLQGEGGRADFIDHLQLVTPRRIERALNAAGLTWCDLSLRKASAVLSGDSSSVVAHPMLAQILRRTGQLLGDRFPITVLRFFGVYPRLVYIIRKPQ